MKRNLIIVVSSAVLSLSGLVASADPVNLLINGDFETGTSLGWSTWRAPWGQQEQYIWNDATAGRSGNYDLKITAKGSSFGVYQTVSVIPGHYYRLEAKWKATVTADPNWFEIELLQGGYDYDQTDIRPYDLPNKMYSYDAPENPPVTFDWTLTPTLDGGPADSPAVTDHYHGVRQATGNQMTVVLKAGGNPSMNASQSVVSWFDDVVFYEVPEPASIVLLVLGGSVLLRRR